MIIKEDKMNNLKKTLLISAILSFITVISVVWLQTYNQDKIVTSCSYLDPVTIDLLAFFASLFLIIEGLARIIEHPNATVKRQLTRVIRIIFGFAILTLHILQFVHK